MISISLPFFVGGIRIPGKQAIRALLSRLRTSDITEPQPAMSMFSIEVHHNAVHNSIGGHFSALDTSTFDPVFWFLHVMFSYIWYLFKNNQRSRGIDPQRDYPRGPNVPPGHEFFQTVNFMPFHRPMTNLETFSDRFDRIVRYDPLLTCQRCRGNPYLACVRGTCVARSRRRGGAVIPGIVTPVLVRGKRSVHTQDKVIQDKSAFIQTHEEAISTLDRSYTNTFIVNGYYAPKDWVYLNIRVLYERPRGLHFNSNESLYDNDMHDPSSFHDSGKGIGIQNRVLYKPKCAPAGSGATKVFVRSNGLNYHGTYKEFSIVDERQAVSATTVQVAVRKPTDENTETYLSAYDTCGRVCRPACPVRDRSSTVYKACSGSFKISTEYPLMYSQSYEAAISSLWHLSLDGKGPLFRNTFSPITFICDHQNSWPWASS